MLQVASVLCRAVYIANRKSAVMLMALVAVGGPAVVACADDGDAGTTPTLMRLLDPDPAIQLQALERLDSEWSGHMSPALLEYISLAQSPLLLQRSLTLLRKHTGQDFGYDVNAWFSWVWKQNFSHPPHYAAFKSELYRRIDPRFGRYFSAERPTRIALDEVRWGGVRQDGIPPLRQPAMIAAEDASYLDDENVVFGIEINGDARAFPKRILAWHEMFVDSVGGVAVAGVYCTLCGSVILYETVVDGVQHDLGTSGFLYRSNKLMYDKATQSLWNTMWGRAVIGPLAKKEIRLPRRTVVTTTWGEWQRRHPHTTVLSIKTGHRRDYSEGAAYRQYFSTDELMFSTSQVDTRLANKAEVLGVVLDDADGRPLAVAASFARENPLLHERIGATEIVIITDRSGAMRVYESRGRRFADWDGDKTLQDSAGDTWTLGEDGLHGEDGAVLVRLPSQSAFWFGWYGAYTNTRLLN